MKVITETKVRYTGTEFYVFQDENGNVIWPAIDFMIERVRNGDSSSTLATYRQALKRLYGYFDETGLNWLNMDDHHLEEFREWCLELTTNNPRFRGYENVARQTVNHDYLEPIYTFYYWAQIQGRYLPTLLGPISPEGPIFQITSELVNRDEARRNGGKEPSKKYLYPKLFRNTRKSKMSKKASDIQLIELQDYIIQNFSSYEADCLLMIARVISETGARPIALASFIQSQFNGSDIDNELFDTSNQKLHIRPRKQKGGNTMPIEFPIGTALAVRTFIKDALIPFIKSNEYANHRNHLFLNANTGEPLKANNITKMFSTITTKMGWPKGQSLYSLRHRYANDELDRELAISHELGFDTSEPAIRLQVSKKMTHRNEKSLSEYIESRQRFGEKTTAHRQANKIKELEAALASQALETQKALEQSIDNDELVDKLSTENIELKNKIRQLEEKITTKTNL